MKKKKKIQSSPRVPEAAGRINPTSLEEEVKLSYIDYALSVIVSRALPDIRDGLKPVHRRILYAMHEMGLKHSAKYRKSAAVIGAVLGRYHPHGDQSVYDALVRMAQDFSLRYPLIDGQGNFGSIDGDSAAAYRYTEARLAPIAEEMLADIEKETVQYMANYDGTLEEPLVLPSKIPNLLLNGSMGIAVGMATNIPPHNLIEVCDAVSFLIDHPKAETGDIFQFIKGPDFPTGGLIFDRRQIKAVYAMGKGPITVRAKTEIIEAKSGDFQIVVSELPYQTNKANLLQRIAGLVKDKKIADIRDIRDESAKGGVRIAIELRRGAYPQKILNRLFKLTELQGTFHINMVALLDGIQPRLVSFKEILEEYIKHRQIIVRRRTEFDLTKTRDRIHILKGLKIAIDHIDEVIRLIRSSRDRDQAKIRLMKKYRLSEAQTQAILEMRLHQLANLERAAIEKELKEKIKLAGDLEKILASPKMLLKIIKKELAELKEKYGDERRTRLISKPVMEFKEEDLIPDEPTVVIITKDGYIKRISPEGFKIQARGGKGVVGLETKEEDVAQILVSTTTHADLLFFTTRGKVFQLKTYEIPETKRTGKGQSLVNFLDIGGHEKVSALLPISELGRYKYLVMATRGGIIKKVAIESLKNVRRSGLLAIKLKVQDFLEWVKPTTGKNEIILITAGGMAIRFKEKDIRPMGRAASGVFGIRLKKDDFVVGMDTIKIKNQKLKISARGGSAFVGKNGEKLLVVSEKGFGKMTFIKNYRLQRRGGRGIKTANVTDKTGRIIQSLVIDEKNFPPFVKGDLLLVSRIGKAIRLGLASIPTTGRVTRGVKLMRFKNKEDKVASVTLI